jgi:hypothetical protein
MFNFFNTGGSFQAACHTLKTLRHYRPAGVNGESSLAGERMAASWILDHRDVPAEHGQQLVDLVQPHRGLALLQFPDESQSDTGPVRQPLLRQARFLPQFLDLGGRCEFRRNS